MEREREREREREISLVLGWALACISSIFWWCIDSIVRYLCMDWRWEIGVLFLKGEGMHFHFVLNRK